MSKEYIHRIPVYMYEVDILDMFTLINKIAFHDELLVLVGARAGLSARRVQDLLLGAEASLSRHWVDSRTDLDREDLDLVDVNLSYVHCIALHRYTREVTDLCALMDVVAVDEACLALASEQSSLQKVRIQVVLIGLRAHLQAYLWALRATRSV